jgi:hypothetical protein
LRWNEAVARHNGHGTKRRRIGDVAGDKIPFDHARSLFIEGIVIGFGGRTETQHPTNSQKKQSE